MTGIRTRVSLNVPITIPVRCTLSYHRDTEIAHFRCTVSLSSPGDLETKKSQVRIKRWSFEKSFCAGNFIRWICSVGVGDLPWINSTSEMFLNKIRMEREPAAYICLERWYIDRSLGLDGQEGLVNANYTFDIQFYANQPFALDHVAESLRTH